MKRVKLIGILVLTIAILCTSCSSSNNDSKEKKDSKEDSIEENQEDVEKLDASEEDKNKDHEKESSSKAHEEANTGKLNDDLTSMPDDSGKNIDVHDIDGNVAISYTVPDHFYLSDNMGNLGVEEYPLTYPFYDEALGMQSEVIKIDSLKEIGICSTCHTERLEKAGYADFYVTTVETNRGKVFDILHFEPSGGWAAYISDDYNAEHVHFIIRGWVHDEVSDSEPWTEDEVLDIIKNNF